MTRKPDDDPVRDLMTRLATRHVWQLDEMAMQAPGEPAAVMRHRLAVAGLLHAEALVWPEDGIQRAARQYGGLVATELNLDTDYARLQLALMLDQLASGAED